MTNRNLARLTQLEEDLMAEYKVAEDAEARQEVLSVLDRVQREIYGDEAVDSWTRSEL
jgi:hypothetical protein